MKEISLTQGKFAIVDDVDYEELKAFKWFVVKSGGTFYASRKELCKTGRRNLFMHRQILRLENPEVITDHINGDGLDNRKTNIRACSNMENMRNRKVGKNNTSGVKGVYWAKKDNRWRARIKLNGRFISLGHFSDKKEAAKAYDDAAKQYYGEFARLNGD